jgi:hypothetical protein
MKKTYFRFAALTLAAAIAALSGCPQPPAFEDEVDTGSAAYSTIVAMPVITPLPGNYLTLQIAELFSATAGAEIWYTTDGSAPEKEGGASILYKNPITIFEPVTIKAVAYKTGMQFSNYLTAVYTMTQPNQVFTPVTSLDTSPTYTSAQSVTLTSATPAARIWYTTDGSQPAKESGTSRLYETPFSISATATLKAVAVKESMTDSRVLSAAYTFQAGAPSASLGAGTYFTVQNVTLDSATEGAQIWYTTDGAEPTEENKIQYQGAIALTQSTTLKSMAVKEGMMASEVLSAVYTLQTAQPTVSLPGGPYDNAQSVTLATETEGAQIWYTTDGTWPGRESGTSRLYTGSFSVGDTTLRARTVKSGWADSDVLTSVYTVQADTPTASLPAGSYDDVKSVTLATTTAGAQIWYTIDGSWPGKETGTSTLYSGPISINGTTTLRARAIKTGIADSGVLSALYTLQTVAPTATLPTAAYTSAQSVTLATTTAEAQIWYTIDGSWPGKETGTSTLYSGPISINGTTTLKAIAVKANITSSAVLERVYTFQVAAPTASVAAGTYDTAQSVTLGAATEGAQIWYTTNGSAPSQANGTQYTVPISINGTTTLKAVAVKSGWTSSAVLTAAYAFQAAAPTASVAAGTYDTAQSVTLATATGGAEIRYTTNGSTPTASSTLYSGAISISATTTLKAIAVKSGWTNSAALNAVYTLQAATPTVSLAAGTYPYPQLQSISLSTATGGAEIRYTTNGSTPTASSTLYSGPISLYQTTTLKAITVKSGWPLSGVLSVDYTFQRTSSIKTTFGISQTGTAGVAAAFTAASAYVSSKTAAQLASEGVIQLGDYIDLEGGLTVTQYFLSSPAVAGNGFTEIENNGGVNAANTPVNGGANGTLLRLIVVGINSFNAQGYYYDGNGNGTNAHLVFQFQNLPARHRIHYTNDSSIGYKDSTMRAYVKGNFYTGLVAAGVPESVFWAPRRYVANKGKGATGADLLIDKLWLPTTREMFGTQNYFSGSEYETEANQALLEYYGPNGYAHRKKYKADGNRANYWLSSPDIRYTNIFTVVDVSGYSTSSSVATVYGLAPAFCIR